MVVAAAAVLVLVVSLAAFAVVRSSEDSAPYVGSVPDGWKPIVVGSVQFAVPEGWPIHDQWSCWDQATNGVYLVEAPPDAPSCSAEVRELNVGASSHPMNVDSVLAAVGNPQAGPHVTLEDLNGLRAVLDYRDDTGFSYTFFLVDDDVMIGLTFSDDVDRDIAEQIIDTIGPVPD